MLKPLNTKLKINFNKRFIIKNIVTEFLLYGFI
jgi:hypothetical protein